ncbi:MAG: hypothetical protein L0H88_07620 [Propionibacterium sp.]|nr:hypothetical protein [Propionibacterium sp.]
MHPAATAGEVLGGHARATAELLVETIRGTHARFAEAHVVSGTKYGNCFGTQWRDLLDDVAVAFERRGYRTYRPPMAGYRLPVINDCLVYVWRLRESRTDVSSFASSPTRENVFSTPMLAPMLFEPEVDPESGEAQTAEAAELEQIIDAATEAVMPLVLVTVRSSPRQSPVIEWGLAVRDSDTGEVRLLGGEMLSVPEPQASRAAASVEPFDSGVPTPPPLEPRKQEGTDPDAR